MRNWRKIIMKIQVNGHQVYAYTANYDIDKNKPTILFVHGAANDHSVFALQSRYFAYHQFNSVAVDLPAHGRSQGELLGSVEELAQWVVDVIEALGVESVYLAGHSMGALIALQAAPLLEAKKQLNKLILLGAAYPMQVAPVLLDAAQNQPQKAYEMINEWSLFRKAQTNPTPGFWQHTKNMRIMQRSAKGAIYNDLLACNAYSGGENAAQNIKSLTLFICGKQDKMAPVKACQLIESKIDNTQKIVINECGHSMMAEKPDDVLAAIKEFIM